jgi:fructokinase
MIPGMTGAPAQPLVVGIGEVLWDLLPGGKRLGGAPANFAYHARLLGARACVASAVGKDPLGDEILSHLGALGVDVSSIQTDPDHPTGAVGVVLDAAGVPSYVIHPDVAWDFIAQTPALIALAGGADAVCFGTLAQRSPVSRSTIRHFLQGTSDSCLRLLDVNFRQHFYDREILDASLQLASVLKLNDQELPAIGRLLGFSDQEGEAIPALLSRYPLRLVAMTRAERGSSLYTTEGADHHDGFPADTVDTVGAGDAFAAALAIGLLRGEMLDRINQAANRLASFVCTRHGAMPPVPTDLLQRIWQ